MKKVLALILASVMALSLAACAPGNQKETNQPDAPQTSGTTESVKPNDGKKTVLNVWSFTEEVPTMVDAYFASHPDYAAKYEPKYTVIAMNKGAYGPALDQALLSGGNDAPDIYCAEAGFVLKYTQGESAKYAATYEDLGIDVEAETKAAGIAPYIVDIGTRDDGKVIGLGYQSTGGVMIYRRSIAKEVFGTDDPAEISKVLGGGTGNWDKYFEAAKVLQDKGYAICSSLDDVWHPVENSAKTPWIVDGKLCMDPAREAFIDIAKEMHDKGYSNETNAWSEGWFADMQDAGTKKVFSFMGPAWMVNTTIANHSGGKAVGEGTYGDWAICEPPIGFFIGGTWMLANKETTKTDVIADILRWCILDSSDNGLQYLWANGKFTGYPGMKTTVASSVVMDRSSGESDFIGGQDMFKVFVPANEYVNGKTLTPYDQTISNYWLEQCKLYASGQKTRNEAIAAFKQNVADNLDIVVDFD